MISVTHSKRIAGRASRVRWRVWGQRDRVGPPAPGTRRVGPPTRCVLRGISCLSATSCSCAHPRRSTRAAQERRALAPRPAPLVYQRRENKTTFSGREGIYGQAPQGVLAFVLGLGHDPLQAGRPKKSFLFGPLFFNITNVFCAKKWVGHACICPRMVTG